MQRCVYINQQLTRATTNLKVKAIYSILVFKTDESFELLKVKFSMLFNDVYFV